MIRLEIVLNKRQSHYDVIEDEKKCEVSLEAGEAIIKMIEAIEILTRDN